jgi:hypothetical protein
VAQDLFPLYSFSGGPFNILRPIPRRVDTRVYEI